MGMTAVLVLLGVLGKQELAADVAIVQGASLALFYGFSANARSVILRADGLAVARSFLLTRLVLMVPLGGIVYVLGTTLGGVSSTLCLILIARKCTEWLSEIHLSAAEKEGGGQFAPVYLALQGLLLLAVGCSAVFGILDFEWVLALWAVLPLFLSLPYLSRCLRGGTGRRLDAAMLLPHLGSSAIVGIGVFMFRLTVLSFVEKDTAGILFTGFALGGLLGSIFVFGIGPSLAHAEHKTGKLSLPRPLRLALIAVGLVGVLLTVAVHLVAADVAFLGKTVVFWQTLGFSLLGSVVMVFAQRQRLRDLQWNAKDDVFAPDVLVNIIIVILIPAVFFALGVPGMTALYLINALVALAFYWMMDEGRAARIVKGEHFRFLQAAIVIAVVTPIFFHISGGIFRSANFLFDWEGDFRKFPLPIAVLGCYLGIALLGNFSRANRTLIFIFGTFVLMVLTTVAATGGDSAAERAKVFLLLQYLLPMFALVLGSMFDGRGDVQNIFEKSIALIVAVIMPLQLIASVAQGEVFLSPYLYLFSIYHHLQYVPVIFVACFVISFFALWEQAAWRKLLVWNAFWLGPYVAASGSMAGLAIVLLALVVFIAQRLWLRKAVRVPVVTAVIFLTAFLAYSFWAGSSINADAAGPTNPLRAGNVLGTFSEKFKPVPEAHVQGPVVEHEPGTLSNMNSRREIWRFYAGQLTSNWSSLLLGQNRPPERAQWPSAHNYYLDFAYNFGLIAGLPLIALLLATGWMTAKSLPRLLGSPAMLGLAMVVCLLLLGDNMVKVSLRMPYAGIFTFFVWGLLLARLSTPEPRDNIASPGGQKR